LYMGTDLDHIAMDCIWSTAASAEVIQCTEMIKQHHNKHNRILSLRQCFICVNTDRISCYNQIASCVMTVWGIPQHLYPRKSASQQIPSVSKPTYPCLCHSEPTMLATGNTTPSRCTEAFTHSIVPPTLLSCNTKRTLCCAQDLHKTRCPGANCVVNGAIVAQFSLLMQR
jgi:hypothetical protein